MSIKNTKNKTKRKTKKSFYNEYNNEYNLSLKIFNTISIEKQLHTGTKYNYWIISKEKEYNEYFNVKKYMVAHFMLYCMLRFTPYPEKHIFDTYINFPVIFPTKIHFTTILKYKKYYTFNYLLYLNNFLYHLLETNQYLDTFIKESKPTKWGYNVSNITINNKQYYNIYFIIKRKYDIAQTDTLISNNYPKLYVDKYFAKLRYFYKAFQLKLIEHNFITTIGKYVLTHKPDYINKFFNINGLFIPKCHIELNDEQPLEVYMYLLHKEINYPTPDRLQILATIAKKYRNTDKLLEDLNTATVSTTDFNDMIQSKKPLGFSTTKLYHDLMHDIANIVKTRFNNFTLKIIGSGTTFYSASPKVIKANKFYSYETSDIDINIIPNENFDKYKTELDTINNGKYNTNIGVYVNPLTREFFGEELMGKFFKKWGPQELGNFPKIYEPVNIEDTKLKRPISITITTKRDLFEYFEIIQTNKTCLSNFSTFIRNGNTISYWDDGKYITKPL